MFKPIEFFVVGQPKGQPRPRAFAFAGKARMYDPGTAEAWKGQIAAAWKDAAPDWVKIECPVSLMLSFYMPRPKSHFKKSGLRPDAPTFCAKKPDADNMAKAVMDALTQIGVWGDDDQVVVLRVVKQFTMGGNSGCAITLKDAAL